jgi:hypothetical protein
VPVQVVAVHGHVERAGRDVGCRDAADDRGEALGEHDAAGGDAEEDEPFGSAIGFEDLVGDASDRPIDVSLLQHGAHSHADSLLRLTGRASRLPSRRAYQSRRRRLRAQAMAARAGRA